MIPETRYTISGGVDIAYQVFGDGPIDLIVVPGWVSNLETYWERPDSEAFYRRLGSFARLLLFDKRGTGLSGRVTDLPTLEVRMDDARAVMDATGSRRAGAQGRGRPMAAVRGAPVAQGAKASGS